MRSLFAFFFKLFGWKTEGNPPTKISKYILVVAPHTSNWDFLVGLGARATIKFNPRYVAKKELFFWPAGILFRALGGYPVERSEKTDFVQNMVDIFQREDKFILTITPEGTRKYAKKWKSGFYYIAKAADVPIVPVAFDYSSKTVVVGKAILPNDDLDVFIEKLQKWFEPYKGKIPENGIVLPSNK